MLAQFEKSVFTESETVLKQHKARQGRWFNEELHYKHALIETVDIKRYCTLKTPDLLIPHACRMRKSGVEGGSPPPAWVQAHATPALMAEGRALTPDAAAAAAACCSGGRGVAQRGLSSMQGS